MTRRLSNPDGTRYFCSDDGLFCEPGDDGQCPHCSFGPDDATTESNPKETA